MKLIIENYPLTIVGLLIVLMMGSFQLGAYLQTKDNIRRKQDADSYFESIRQQKEEERQKNYFATRAYWPKYSLDIDNLDGRASNSKELKFYLNGEADGNYFRFSRLHNSLAAMKEHIAKYPAFGTMFEMKIRILGDKK